MKKLLLISLLLLTIAGCTSSTKYGDCVGIGDEKDPSLVYKVSTWNIIVGIFGIELIAPPVIVLVDEFYCPVRKK